MSSNAVTMAAQVKSLSDQELREQLTGLGMDVGPITGTTRTLYERKLVQMLTGSRPEFGGDSPAKSSSGSPPKSSPKSSPSPRKSPVLQRANETTPFCVTDGSPQLSSESTINLIRARKPVSRVANEEPVSRKSMPRQSMPSTPFPAANAQFRRTESGGSAMDHILKYVLFGIVMLVIVYFISNQEPGKSLEHKS